MATRRTTGPVRAPESAQPPEKATQRRRAAAPETPASTRITVSEDARRAMIAEAAYLRAQRRGFAAGDEVEDWLAAEAEVDRLLRAGNGELPQH